MADNVNINKSGGGGGGGEGGVRLRDLKIFLSQKG